MEPELLDEHAVSQSLINASTKHEPSIPIPNVLREGVVMLKVTAKKSQKRKVRIAPEQGQLLWESRRSGTLYIESISELRFGVAGRHYRELFKISANSEPRWITIIFRDGPKYKILHFVALSDQDFNLWKTTLESLVNLRQELMGGLNQMNKRSALWLRQHWNLANHNEPTSPSSLYNLPLPTSPSRLSFSNLSTKNLLSTNDERNSLDGSGNGNDKQEDLVDIGDILMLCSKLGLNAPSSELKLLFDQADIQNRQKLNFAEFQIFVKLLKRRPEIESLLLQITNENNNEMTISLDEFVYFMKNTQNSSLSDQDLQNLYKKYSNDSKIWTLDNLTSFLMSSDNTAIDEKHQYICQDMTRPLNEYFINSSHNTYLTGSQLTGQSSPEGYIRALQQGARCVELDVWDGPNGEPIIFHGHTLTSKITVHDALIAIAKYAFVISSYPVILSFELHCDTAQQDRLAQLLRDILGDSLLSEPIKHHQKQGIDELPSPEDLRWKFLVKAKDQFLAKELASQKSKDDNANSKLNASSNANDTDSSETTTTTATSGSQSDSDLRRALSSAFRRIRKSSDSNVPTVITTNINTGQVTTLPSSPHAPPPSAVSPTNPNTTASANLPPLGDIKPSDRKTSEGQSISSSLTSSRSSKKTDAPMSFEMLAMLVYTVGVKCRGFNKKEVYAPTHTVSISERRLSKMTKQADADLLAHNRTHLVRTYPAGTRLSSTNFLPHNHWAVGCQMVALNWQTHDLGTEFNYAHFVKNGKCGYVLKPEVLRIKSDKDKEFMNRFTNYVFKVEIISGQQLVGFRSNSDNEEISSPYIEVEVLPPFVEVSKAPRMVTKAVEENAFNPLFQTSFDIPFQALADMLELVFVRFSAKDAKGSDINLGRFCTSLDILNSGYRHLPLYDDSGQQFLFSSLFVKTSVQLV